MIERALIGIPALLALGAGAALAGGLPALIVGAIGVVVLATTVTRPGWANGPTLVAAALITQVAVADERAWWRAVIAALLLAAVLITSEIAQIEAWHACWRPSLDAHRRAGLAILIGIAVVTGAAGTVLHGTTLATLLIGLGAGAAVLTVIVIGAGATGGRFR